MQRQIELIGAAWGLGGANPGCAEAPARLIPLIEARLRACGASTVLGATLTPFPSERRKQLAVSRLCARLGAVVAHARREGRLPCVIGGDHSCAAGTWSGVARTMHGQLGMVWVDAHMDAHTPGTSHSGRLHGMPLAWLLGEDDDPLYGLTSGVLDPAHVCLVGVRSFEPEEAARLKHLGVRVIQMPEIRSRGLDAALDEALAIATDGTEAYGVSIDLDAITPEEAPGVGTPVEEGLSGHELARGIANLGGNERMAGIELVEYVPKLDPDGRTARVAVEILASALCGAGENPDVLADAVEGEHP